MPAKKTEALGRHISNGLGRVPRMTKRMLAGRCKAAAQIKKDNRDARIAAETGGLCCRCGARAKHVVALHSHFELLCRGCNGRRGAEIRQMNAAAKALQTLLFPEASK